MRKSVLTVAFSDGALAVVLGLSTFAAAVAASALQAQDVTALSCVSEFNPAGADYEFVDRASAGTVSQLDAMASGAEIGNIHITRLPIFDENNPDEDNLLYRWANRFHIMTRENTVRQVLLFNSSSDFNSRLMEESGRLLREEDYLYDAAVRPVSRCGDRVDVEVITKDSWSLTPNLAFDRFGGENSFSFGLRDSNLLGFGKTLAFSFEDDLDQKSKELSYEDNYVFGTRLASFIALGDTDEGEEFEFNIGLPFYSLYSTRAWSLQLDKEKRQDEQFFRGDEVSAVEIDHEDYAFEWGLSEGLVGNHARRWWFGYRYQRDRFGPSPELPSPARFPEDRTLSYPYVKFESVEDNFVTSFNLDQILRTEDLQIGANWSLSLGYAAEAFGSDADRIVVNGAYTGTLRYDNNSLWQHSLQVEGLWHTSRGVAEDVLLQYENRYFWRRSDQRSFYAQLTANYSHNLRPHRQVVLGGLTGARGFENEFQAGDRSLLLTVEERLYTDIHLLNLLRLGGALFIDVGRAWEPGQDNGTEEDLLADVGFGLRLASSKAASDRIAHLDFAFPISNRDDPKVDTVLISFTVKGRF